MTAATTGMLKEWQQQWPPNDYEIWPNYSRFKINRNKPSWAKKTNVTHNCFIKQIISLNKFFCWVTQDGPR